jgi:hypothetical protein
MKFANISNSPVVSTLSKAKDFIGSSMHVLIIASPREMRCTVCIVSTACSHLPLYHHKVDVVTATASRRSGNLSLHLIRVVLIVGREKVKENTLGASLESSIIATLNLNLP